MCEAKPQRELSSDNLAVDARKRSWPQRLAAAWSITLYFWTPFFWAVTLWLLFHSKYTALFAIGWVTPDYMQAEHASQLTDVYFLFKPLRTSHGGFLSSTALCATDTLHTSGAQARKP